MLPDPRLPGPPPAHGDFSPDDFRRMGEAAVERLARYFETLESRPVLARTKPGEVLAQIPARAPEEPEPWEAIERDLDRLVEPNLTHWQHPGYLAYFANTGTAPAVVGDFLAAGYNQVGILWRTSPVLTELEQGVVRWLLDLVGLPWGPDGFDGQLADTASTASLIALAAAREQAFPDVRRTGLAGRPAGRVYCSELAHSSIDKACVVLGFGTEGLRKIPTDADFRMDVPALAAAIARDRAEGRDARRRRRDGGDDDRHVRRPARAPSRTSARARESGCTSTPRTRGRPPSSRRCGRSSRAGSARTRSSTTRTSGCSCRSSARASSSGGWSACAAPSPWSRTTSRRPRARPCASTWTTASSSGGASGP